jgi:hypothetical protein
MNRGSRAAVLVGVVLGACLATGCGSSTVRQYAAVLAADTARLNDQLEGLTKSRQQIEGSRERLAGLLELSTLQTDSYVQRRLAQWTALGADPAFRELQALFAAVRNHTEAAAARAAAIESLGRKVVDARIEASGRRSEQLTETAKHLAALSRAPTIEDKVKFLSGYVKNVQDSLAAARQDAEKAATAAEEKATSAAREPAAPK